MFCARDQAGLKSKSEYCCVIIITSATALLVFDLHMMSILVFLAVMESGISTGVMWAGSGRIMIIHIWRNM